ncbi:MAG: type II toxin-antitoxin system RelE/ParE family toxin [Kofleriaceae bacterium]|nr:MAG: type II toxin-antitoxin system RelE/ParE family toxin [Kofleriaceae bacterium]MBZ0237468.1 type II toxin-antitoxin system RelE/ParE family toxin [Kofleriaceae bacterium]
MIARLHRDAMRDMVEASERHDSPTLDENLDRAVRSALDMLVRFPEMGPAHRTQKTVRVLTLTGLPFVLPYRIDGDVITVLAVAHTSRRPGYWYRRK